jgi:transposase-like protein
MLVELSVMEQRYQAVLAVTQDGWKIVEVARKLGVSRQSVHAWVKRYEQGGLAASALKPLGRRPYQSRPYQNGLDPGLRPARARSGLCGHLQRDRDLVPQGARADA